MHLCDELAGSLKLAINLKKDILNLIENEISEEKQNKLNEIFQEDDIISQKLQKVLFYLCLEKDVDYSKYGFSEPAITIDDRRNNMSEKEIQALISGLNEECEYYLEEPFNFNAKCSSPEEIQALMSALGIDKEEEVICPLFSKEEIEQSKKIPKKSNPLTKEKMDAMWKGLEDLN